MKLIESYNSLEKVTNSNQVHSNRSAILVNQGVINMQLVHTNDIRTTISMIVDCDVNCVRVTY